MLCRWISAIFLLSTPALAFVQAPETKENIDIGGLLSEGKKPCDGDKKTAEAQKKNDQVMQGLIGQITAEKQAAAEKLPAAENPACSRCCSGSTTCSAAASRSTARTYRG